MNMPYRFKPEESCNIINRFGQSFYTKALRDIEVYADKWKLGSIQFIPSYSANLVFICYSELHGQAVLKIGNPLFGELLTEFNTLKQYNGRRFCKVFDADVDNGVLLEQCVQPGTGLRKESSLERRLSVFCSLYSGLHMPPAQAELCAGMRKTARCRRNIRI